MAKENVICMNAADKETSYANNSLAQKRILLKTRPILEDTIKTMFTNADLPACIRVADLGCASGPNTFFTISAVIDTVCGICQQAHLKSPEIQVFLNDLPQSDFNDVFMNVPSFYERLKKEKGDTVGPCFVTGVPGSFYERLFPTNSLHFIHSSYSVHWLSQAPSGLDNNCGNIYISKSSPPNVPKAYFEQFEKDFSNFLRSRFEEMIAGGRMLLTVPGRSITDHTSKDCCYMCELLAESLLDLVHEGLVQESDVDSFNMPLYFPCQEELREIVQKEGSFNLDKIENLKFNWYPDENSGRKNNAANKHESGEYVANSLRAVTESLLANQFGKTIIDDLFRRYAKNVAENLSSVVEVVSIVISLTRK